MLIPGFRRPVNPVPVFARTRDERTQAFDRYPLGFFPSRAIRGRTALCLSAGRPDEGGSEVMVIPRLPRAARSVVIGLAALAALVVIILDPITLPPALWTTVASAQVGGTGPPAVGVVPVERRPMTERAEFNGRVEARERVDLVPLVTAFLDEQLFKEGASVKKGDRLYRLERAPFAADVEIKEAGVAQAEAQLENANVALQWAEELLKRATGTQVTADNARATQRTADAQLKSAIAQLHQSQINLGYTDIRSPIDGRIGRTSVTPANVVSPTSGTLARIVSQDPMYVVSRCRCAARSSCVTNTLARAG